MAETLGKKAERKLKEWLNHPDDGLDMERIPDQLSGQFGSMNICDFHFFRQPNLFYIESKATENDNFPFSMITDYQYESLLKKSQIRGVFGVVVVLFAVYQRAFILDIRDIDSISHRGDIFYEGKKQQSLNIKKLDKWPIPYREIRTIPNKRKYLLDYTGEWPTDWMHFRDIEVEEAGPYLLEDDLTSIDAFLRDEQDED